MDNKLESNAQECLNKIFIELLGEDGSSFDWIQNYTFNEIMTKKLIDKYSNRRYKKFLKMIRR